MFSRFASASRRAARHLSTAAAGDGSGFLIAGGVGVAAIACMVPRADESTHAATPPVADDASCQVQELDATFISSAGFGYGATLEGGSTSPSFSPADAVDLGIEWNDRGEISAYCYFTEDGESFRVQRLNLRRLLRRDAGEVGVVPVVGVPDGAQATIGSGSRRMNRELAEKFRDLMRRHSLRVPGDPVPARAM